MTVHKHKIAAVAIKKSEFTDIPQMNRWRRICAKYKDSHLVQNGNSKDYKAACAGFMVLEALKIDEISLAAAMKSIFTDSLGDQ